jgi:hypothetical protein
VPTNIINKIRIHWLFTREATGVPSVRKIRWIAKLFASFITFTSGLTIETMVGLRWIHFCSNACELDKAKMSVDFLFSLLYFLTYDLAVLMFTCLFLDDFVFRTASISILRISTAIKVLRHSLTSQRATNVLNKSCYFGLRTLLVLRHCRLLQRSITFNLLRLSLTFNMLVLQFINYLSLRM